jgi:hypothetical protein
MKRKTICSEFELLGCKFGGSYSFDFLSMIQARLTGLVKDEDPNN